MKKLISALCSVFRLAAASANGRSYVPPAGLVADNFGPPWGLLGFVQNVEQCLSLGFASTASSSQTVTASAADVATGIMNRTGSPGGAVVETTPTAAQIIAALPNTIPLDGTFQYRLRYINNGMGQTVTWTAGSGVTVTGTATIATNAWREFLVCVESPTVVSFTNLGGGTL